MENYKKIGLLWLYILLILVLPVIGEFFVWRGFPLESGKASLALIACHTAFIFVMMSIAFGVANYKLKKTPIAAKFDTGFAVKVVTRSVFILGLAFLVTFALAGWKSFFGSLNSGDIRVSLGVLGPVYTWILLYLTPAILILNSIIYIHSGPDTKKRTRLTLLVLFLVAAAIGMMTASKATFAFMVIGGIVVLTYGRLSFKKLVLLAAVISAGLIFMTVLTRRSDLSSASIFLLHRATVMSSFGTIAAWNLYPDGIPAETRLYNLLIIGGNNFASAVSGYPKNSVEYLKIDLSRLITYMSYPDAERTIKGAVNVTITNFGESILLLGRRFFIIYAIFAGLVIGIVIRKFNQYVMYGMPLKGALVGVYLFSVIVPWINSASLWNLIGLPMFIWLSGVYIAIYLIVAVKPVKIGFGRVPMPARRKN